MRVSQLQHNEFGDQGLTIEIIPAGPGKCARAGLIPTDEVFAGLGHPAIIIIALVLEILALASAIPLILLVWPL